MRGAKHPASRLLALLLYILRALTPSFVFSLLSITVLYARTCYIPTYNLFAIFFFVSPLSKQFSLVHSTTVILLFIRQPLAHTSLVTLLPISNVAAAKLRNNVNSYFLFKKISWPIVTRNYARFCNRFFNFFLCTVANVE